MLNEIHLTATHTSQFNGVGDEDNMHKQVERALFQHSGSSILHAGAAIPTPTSRRLYPYKNEQEARWSASCYLNNTVTIGLTVWKRDSLARQLDEAAQQSLPPSQILVVQSKDFIDASGIIQEWKEQSGDESPSDTSVGGFRLP
jgi:hypothetical protein